ncbi:MAG TPA: hypothetical protein DCZ01_01940 [Elusimicrobia bacterium]|nr:MAG: hypothetical protein A2X37_00225 [Elusimicrobia bacterium GWA2_66_18]OGR73844.1 MAG: hypothetical protein A2X40_02600 [Elusimicrobia bacterium GWC2_65_9]HAZ07290.1 hypothetical protein [Elusimicrobiota bacterium]
MNAGFLALALALAPASAGAADAPPLADMAPARSAPGWATQGGSLLLYDQEGALIQEISIRGDEESGLARDLRGGTSPDGRLAWTLESRRVWNPLKSRTEETRRLLRFFGSSGAELWKDDSVEVPERGVPVLFSADSKTVLIARRALDDWSVEARTWMGESILAIGPFPRVISMELSPNGRYGQARWSVMDKSATHTFFDLTGRKRLDVPSSNLLLGLARIGDDGVARSGSKVVASFEAAASTMAAPGAK